MPAENLGPSETELNQVRDERIKTELKTLEAGRLEHDVAEEVGHAQVEAEAATEKAQLESQITKSSDLYRKTGEYRDTIQVRDARDKVSDVITAAGQSAMDTAGETFIKTRAEAEK